MAECECPAGVPEWLVTFGDMMSLLLTFFIMLVSMSEMKKDEQYQAMVESIQRQFGHDTSTDSMSPGNQKPRNSNYSDVAAMGRARRLDLMQGGQPLKAPVGENAKPQSIRNGDKTSQGFVVKFEHGSSVIAEDEMTRIRDGVEALRGKKQIIEVKGMTSRKPLARSKGEVQNHFVLGFERAMAVRALLLREKFLDEQIRIVTSGKYEVVDKEKLDENDRVEVMITNDPISSSASLD